MDALTGQDLNRWFPLSSPSDFLFFLPPRTNVDSAKKLRLISSAARPCENTALSNEIFGESLRSDTFWQRMGWDSDLECQRNHMTSIDRSRHKERHPSRQTPRSKFDNSNHFRAVPLSDGYHILFTDPSSGCLCLGSDAPNGGPTKLIRKIWFEGPPGLSPLIYASGADLSWGVRVIAVYGGEGDEQSVWFFSVPRDIFDAEEVALRMSRSPIKFKIQQSKDKNLEWKSWIGQSISGSESTNSDAYAGTSPQHPSWLCKIGGQEICKARNLVDITIDSGPGMIVWMFANNGIATAWRLDDGRSIEHVTSSVMSDGTIRMKDADGDIDMVDLAEFYSPSDSLVSYDGTSMTEWSPSPELRSTSTIYHSDVVLPPSAWSAHQGRYAFEHLAWTILESGTFSHMAHWAGAEDIQVRTNYITRLDVEIH